MIVKQIAGDLMFLGGKLNEIEPLNFACYNYQATDDNLRDFGDPEQFSWFSCSIPKYFRARSMAFANNWQKFFPNAKKGKKGGVWELAKKKAQNEFDSFKNDTFIVYHPTEAIEPYQFGVLSHEHYNEETSIKKSNNIYTLIESVPV